MTLLMYALEHNCLKFVRTLQRMLSVDRFLYLFHQRARSQMNCFHFAAQNQSLQTLQRLKPVVAKLPELMSQEYI
jgi:hypothetical protein